MAEALIGEKVVSMVPKENTGEEPVSATDIPWSGIQSVNKRIRGSGQSGVGSIGGKKRGKSSFRKGLPKLGEEVPFRCIEEADYLVHSLRAKGNALKTKREILLQQLATKKKMIEKNDKKLKRAEEKYAAFKRQMEQDRKVLAMFAGDQKKAEEFKHQCGEMGIRLLQLWRSKGQQMTKEEVCAIVESSLKMYLDDNAEKEAVHEPMETTTGTVTVKEEPASSDDDCRSNDSHSTVLLPRKPLATAAEARK